METSQPPLLCFGAAVQHEPRGHRRHHLRQLPAACQHLRTHRRRTALPLSCYATPCRQSGGATQRPLAQASHRRRAALPHPHGLPNRHRLYPQCHRAGCGVPANNAQRGAWRNTPQRPLPRPPAQPLQRVLQESKGFNLRDPDSPDPLREGDYRASSQFYHRRSLMNDSQLSTALNTQLSTLNFYQK